MHDETGSVTIRGHVSVKAFSKVDTEKQLEYLPQKSNILRSCQMIDPERQKVLRYANCDQFFFHTEVLRLNEFSAPSIIPSQKRNSLSSNTVIRLL